MSLLSTPDRRSQHELQQTGVQLLLVKATTKLYEFPDQESITARLDCRFRLLCGDTQFQAILPMTPTPSSTIMADSTSTDLRSRANCPDQMSKTYMPTPTKQALGKRRRHQSTPFSELVDKSRRPTKMLKRGGRTQDQNQPSFLDDRLHTYLASTMLQYQQQILQENTLSQTSLDHVKGMRRFARHGGPNLEDLRGVRTMSLQSVPLHRSLVSSTPHWTSQQMEQHSAIHRLLALQDKARFANRDGLHFCRCKEFKIMRSRFQTAFNRA